VQGPTSSVSGSVPVKESLTDTVTNKTGNPSTSDTGSSVSVQHASSSNNHLSSPKPASGSGLYASASDPVLVPFLDSRIPGSVGTIKREVGSQRIAVEATVNKGVSRDVSGSESSSLIGKGSEMNHSYAHEKMHGKSQGFDGSQLSDASQTTHSLSHTSSAGSRPCSNYSNRSQQLNGPQKGTTITATTYMSYYFCVILWLFVYLSINDYVTYAHMEKQ